MSPRAIGIEPEVHPITDIEASLLFIAHSKQYQACRQVLSICILSAHRSTHVLISRCRSMATDLEIICLSSKQELMADITNRKECFFPQLLKCMQNTSKMLFVLKKTPRIKLHVFQICTLINKQPNYSYSDIKPNAIPLTSLLRNAPGSTRSPHTECNPKIFQIKSINRFRAAIGGI